MIRCPTCKAANANSMVYCGMCRARLKPIPARLREDIRFVVRQQNRRQTTKIITVSLAVITVLSFWGYSHFKQLLVESAQKELIPRITASTDALIKNKVETAVSEAAKSVLPAFQAQ